MLVHANPCSFMLVDVDPCVMNVISRWLIQSFVGMLVQSTSPAPIVRISLQAGLIGIHHMLAFPDKPLLVSDGPLLVCPTRWPHDSAHQRVPNRGRSSASSRRGKCFVRKREVACQRRSRGSETKICFVLYVYTYIDIYIYRCIGI